MWQHLLERLALAPLALQLLHALLGGARGVLLLGSRRCPLLGLGLCPQLLLARLRLHLYAADLPLRLLCPALLLSLRSRNALC